MSLSPAPAEFAAGFGFEDEGGDGGDDKDVEDKTGAVLGKHDV